MEEGQKIYKTIKEWVLQADYDFDTATAMLKSGRYIYAVFMAHLTLEKLLKGLYTKVLKNNPPRTHNLILLLERIEKNEKIDLTGKQIETIEFLNEKSIPSRYPDVLQEVLKQYKKTETTKLLKQVSAIIKCLKNQLKK